MENKTWQNTKAFPNRIKAYTENEHDKSKGYSKEEIERFKEILKETVELNSIRGQIISSATNIEIQLTEAICSLLFEKESQTETLMKDFIFENEFYTFNRKWNLFRNITKKLEPKFTKKLDLKKLRGNIKTAIEIRNNFAHGEFTFTKDKAYLEFRKNAQTKKIEARKEYFNSLHSLFSSILSELQIVIFCQKSKA